MPSFNQLEALYWIDQLGSFERAARKLNTTQSAISKRVQELEKESRAPLFDRSRRSARLTAHGRAVLAVGADILALHDRLHELMNSTNGAGRRLRLGVTELTALTWLPGLVAMVRDSDCEIELWPEVESSETLLARLLDDAVDMIVVPDAFRDPKLEAIRVGQAANAWMCSPHLKVPRGRVALTTLNRFTVLTQDNRSGSGRIYRRWFENEGLSFSKTLSSNSLIALLGLTASGLGVSYLPVDAARPLLRSKQLRIVSTDPQLPPIDYIVMRRRARITPPEDFVLACIRRTCNFSSAIYDQAAG